MAFVVLCQKDRASCPGDYLAMFHQGRLRPWVHFWKRKPGNQAAMGKKVKSTLVLIILKKYFGFFF